MQIPGSAPQMLAGPPTGPPAGPCGPFGFSGGYSESAGEEALYGALLDHQLEASAAAARDLKHRRRMNCVPVLLALFLPWGAFLTIFSLVAFYSHYAAPLTTMLCVVSAFLVSVIQLATALTDRSAPAESRFYPTFMGAALTLAVGLGWALGDLNFWSFMHPAYQADHLAVYGPVDPSSEHAMSGQAVPTRGRRYQDAGRIYFSHEAIVDVNRSASFKMGDLYCVAPIVNPECESSCGYDFWAVGMNCCSEDSPDFHCGPSDNSRAKSGIRMLAESPRAMFRMAVIQAESQHSLVSVHPLFFTWTEDPVKQIASWKKAGFRRFLVAMYISFFVCTAIAMMLPKLTKDL